MDSTAEATTRRRSYRRRTDDERIADLEQRILELKTKKAVQKKRVDPVLKEIPIIVTTGASEVTGVDIRTGKALPSGSYGDDAARRLGTVLHEKLKGLTPDDFIEKPIDPELLSSKMRELLS